MTIKIMTVDDSASIRQMVIFSLNKGNYELSEASNGREALEKLAEKPIDLLITDLDMPEMNGLMLIREVRMIPYCRKIPILIMTTEEDRTMKEKAKASGATGWITKPFIPKQLNDVVSKVLGIPTM